MATVELNGINKIYPNGTQAVFDFNLKIKDGEFIVLVGPSGCGKSTTLRMVAGLEGISTGELLIDGIKVNKYAPGDRDIAMCFQDYALYGNMTIYDNLGISLKLKHKDKTTIYSKVQETAESLSLVEYLNRLPAQLSGGQRQRVSLGRAVVRAPKVFLMDEPLSNLDAKLRAKTRSEIVRLQKRLNVTTIYVTHDQIEAMTMADRIVVMKDGYVQQIGTPYEVYHNPNNMFVGGFIGLPPMNFVKGVIKGQFFVNDYIKVKITDKKYSSLKNYYGDCEGKEIFIGIRPEYLSREPLHMNENKESIVELPVINTEFLGKEYNVELALGDSSFVAKIDVREEAPKETLRIAVLENKVHFFDVTTTNRIDEE